MRRKSGTLVPLEMDILAAIARAASGAGAECHGFLIAKLLREGSEARLLTAHGTLYRALGRLEQMGLLTSRCEDPHIAAAESRPIRRLYRLSRAGATAVNKARAERKAPLRRRKLARA
jgi:PadR family transcriptional regulator PadR